MPLNQLPIGYSPLMSAVNAIILDGSGSISDKTIPAGTFSTDYWFEDRTYDGLSQDTLTKPSIRVKLDSFDSKDGPMQPTSVRKKNVNITVQLAWHLDSGILKQKRFEIEWIIPTTANKLENALSTPGALRYDPSGSNTGLSSGMLQLEKYTNVKYNYSLQVATADIVFSGIMFVSNSNG